MTRRGDGVAQPPARALLLALVVAAPVLTLAALLVVHVLTDRHQQTFESRSLDEARSVLVAVPADIDGPEADALGRALRRPDRLEAVLVDGDGTVSRSSSAIGLADVPADVRAGRVVPASARTTVAGEPFLVAGGPTGTGPSAVFLFFSERPLQQEQARITLVVTSGAAALLVLAASGGWVHSHRRVRALSRRNHRERAYTAHLAHELRTPVGALVTAASLIDEPELRRSPEPLRQPVEVMRNQSRRLRRIVEDLLELSRLETGQVELRLEPVDVGQVLHETLASYGWDEVHLQVTGSTIAHADRQSVARLALNLVGNAVHHAREQVRVTVGEARGSIVLEVADDGSGIDPHLAAVLTGSSRAETDAAQAGHGGRGLGLLITRAHANLLGARVEVEADPGAGTVVRVRLRPAEESVDARDEDSPTTTR